MLIRMLYLCFFIGIGQVNINSDDLMSHTDIVKLFTKGKAYHHMAHAKLVPAHGQGIFLTSAFFYRFYALQYYITNF